ncbi:hypothetical protein QWY20_17010 [Alkalimonas sp. MEB108]|uniref:Uncharacterized protein n=1 Tax=Alkalimonas cellulosilytica TaxID=3058395 RepID=A0ABU7J9H5_9GAMM|nr:hypothetical protein [Alkalimonas sp. MEB108]MEE2003156.1 hypothetical protein [Alkalimonas sp. MEB108]
MNDVFDTFSRLAVPLHQLGFHSERSLLPLVRTLTQYLPITEQTRLLLSAKLAGELQVEEDFAGALYYIKEHFAWYGVYFDKDQQTLVFTSETDGEIHRVHKSQVPELPVPIRTEFHQIYFGYLLQQQLVRRNDILVVTACPGN